MASGEQPSLQKGQKVGSNSSNSRNECDEGQWMSLPNNLEIGPRNMPPKKQRNREKLRSVQGNSSASASNASDNLSCTPVKFQNLQRTKCNTETWLKDQDERTKHRSFDSDEAFSDIDASVTRRGNMNLPVSHTFHSSDRSLDNQRPPSQRSMIENENTKSVKEECKKNEADSAIVFERLSHLMEFISDATSLYQDLEVNAEPVNKDDFLKLREAVKHASDGGKDQKILQSLESDCGGFANGISPSSSISKASVSKDVFLSNDECAGFPCEEECINECSHLFEKFKHPDDKLLALKLQETLLYHMRKKAENKLASLQTSLNRHADGVSVISQNLSADDVTINASNDDHSVNAASQRNSDASDQRQWLDENTSQCQSLDQTQLQINSFRSRAEDLERLHTSLENIKKRVLSIHQIADSKNMTTSLSSDDFDMADVGEKVAAVELERKKLKNKLIELQKKQKRNDELLKELSYLKEITNEGRACNNEDDGSSCNTSSRVPQVQQSKDKKKLEVSGNCSSENICKIQATLQSLEGMVNIISQDCNMDGCSNIESPDSLPRLETAPNSTNQKLSMIHSTLQNLEGMMSSLSQDSNTDAVSNIETSETHPKSVQRQTISTSVKRDNVQKKQNSGFPARRHYEAEGRANEDADLPVATPTPLPSLEKWCDNSEIDKKIRKHVGPKHVKVLNDIMSSIQDTDNSSIPLPAEQVRILSTIKSEEQCSNVEDSGDDSCDSGVGTNMISHGRMPENVCTNAKEICAESHKSLLLDVDNHKRRESVPSDDLETGARRKQKLDKLASQFQQLLQLFPTSERKNDDLVRSSGEGDYAQNRNNPANPVVSEHTRNSKSWDNSFPRQDNLQLTRQNIVSFESQNHNSSSNLHNRDCNSMKKDNINNLSGKMGKLGLQNTVLGLSSGPVIVSSSVSGPSAPVYNLDTMSTFSSEMNQSHCLSNNELESKTAIDVLKQPPKKRGFKRNHDSQLLSNSSIDSEPLDGSSSAMAADNTVAATWGGSSTQDYFEDENDEHIESLDEDDGAHAVGNISNKSRNAELEDQYHHNMHLYIESVANVQEKKLPKPTLSRTQPLLHGNVHTTATKVTRSIAKKRSLSNVTSELYNETQCSSLIPNASENSPPNPTSKFLQQLKSQVDQLNALCQQQQLFHDTNKTNFSVPPTHTSQRNMPYPCPPPQSIPDISQPHNHQLLLCLSQCYHALYMQQLEIQQLQRCLHHNMEDVFHSTNNPSSQAAEDMTFRPWPMSTLSNPLLPSSLYPAEQASPMSFPYMQSPLKTYASSNNPSYPRVSSTPPVRAVIHPASQENTASQETLNNQVPPRTRANNFWDNFRSYSRQNLLSASSNVKRNESSGLSVAPQIRQVHPLVPNESFSRSPDLSNQFSSSEINRNLPNSEAQDIRRSKRSNSSSFGASSANYNSLGAQMKPLPQVINASCVRTMTSNSFPHNVERVPPNSNPSSVNLIQLYPVQLDSKVGSFSSIRPTTATESTISEALVNDSTDGQSEHSDFLVGLFREAQAIQSEGRRQSALQLIRALAVKDRRELEVASENKIQNDHPAITNRTECGTGAASSTGESCSQLCPIQASEADTDKTASKTPCEASVPWSNQNLPTAAISPLNKHSAQRPVSTGAVRKKPRQSNACSSDSASNLITNTMHDPPELDNPWENAGVGMSSQFRAPSECANKIVEKVISDLQSIFPHGQMKEDPCPGFWAAVNAYILDSLKAMFPLSHKTQAALQRALDHFLSRFSGMRFIECEFEFLKCLSEFLYELVTCYMSTGRFTSPLYTSNFDEDISVLEDDKMHELCVKMPADPYDKTRELSIKMPVDENDVFSSQFRTVFSQNVGDGNSNSDMALPAVRAVSPEEDVECDCGPGIELEHEVEAGTEADLAEADQSPGQQGNSASGIASTAEAWSVDQTSEFLAKNFGAVNSAMMISSEKYDSEASGELSAVTELGLALQVCLDDIPTKLCPTSEEEHHCEPMRDEQSVSLPMQEMNDAEENIENKCDNELSNAK